MGEKRVFQWFCFVIAISLCHLCVGRDPVLYVLWIPAFAGMTGRARDKKEGRVVMCKAKRRGAWLRVRQKGGVRGYV